MQKAGRHSKLHVKSAGQMCKYCCRTSLSTPPKGERCPGEEGAHSRCPFAVALAAAMHC